MFKGARTGTAGPQVDDDDWHHAIFAFYGNDAGFGVANRREIILDGGAFVTYSWSIASGAAEPVDNGDGSAAVTCTGNPGDIVEVRLEASDGACGTTVAVHRIVVGEAGRRFQRANVNGGAIDIGDAIRILNFLFGDQPLSCRSAADVNDDGQNDIADPIALLNYLFVAGSPAPRPPFPDCGVDPTPDALACESFPPCQ